MVKQPSLLLAAVLGVVSFVLFQAAKLLYRHVVRPHYLLYTQRIPGPRFPFISFIRGHLPLISKRDPGDTQAQWREEVRSVFLRLKALRGLC